MFPAKLDGLVTFLKSFKTCICFDFQKCMVTWTIFYKKTPEKIQGAGERLRLLIVQLCLYENEESPGVVTVKAVVFAEGGGSLKSVKSKWIDEFLGEFSSLENLFSRQKKGDFSLQYLDRSPSVKSWVMFFSSVLHAFYCFW